MVGQIKRKFRLSSTINCLEQLPTDSRREVIVAELFPAEAPLPTHTWEVVNRLGQLIFASKLKFDRKLFRTVDGIITFLQKIQPHIPEQFRDNSVYQELFVKHKIDALTAIVADFPKDQANAEDFSRETIRSRIELGTSRPSVSTSGDRIRLNCWQPSEGTVKSDAGCKDFFHLIEFLRQLSKGRERLMRSPWVQHA